MRVAVLGAGIVGVHVATELAQRGADVTLVEAGEPGRGTTAGSLAWINASASGLADYLELRLHGVRAWRRRTEGAWLSMPGTIMWAPDSPRHVERLERLGERVERLGARTVRRHEPDLVVPEGVDTVYRLPGEGWVQAGAAIEAMLERGRAAGLRVRAGTPGQPSDFDDVVVSCVGRWTGSLLAATGVDVPMLEPGQPPVSGFVVRTGPVDARISSVIVADDFLIRPDAGGRLLLHSDRCDAQLTIDTAPAALLEMLRRRVRGCERAGIEDAWVCQRAIPADRLPVVGWARDNLYVVATHSGVTLAPALAELVASELIDGVERSELTRFRPERFRAFRP